MAARFRSALTAYERNIAREGPAGPPAHCWAAAVYEATGQIKKAEEVVDTLISTSPAFRLSAWNFLTLIEDKQNRVGIEKLFAMQAFPIDPLENKVLNPCPRPPIVRRQRHPFRT